MAGALVVDTVPVDDTAGAPGLGPHRGLLGWVLAVVAPVALTAVLLAVDEGARSIALEAMLYLSLAVAVALVGGRWPALVAAVAAALLLNYFFIPPRRTLNVASGNDVLTLLVFVVTAVAVAAVVDAAARRREQARVAEHEASMLAMLNRQVLGGEYDVPRLLALARDTFGAEAAELVPDEPPGRRRHRRRTGRGRRLAGAPTEPSWAPATGPSRPRSPPTSACCASARSSPDRAWPRSSSRPATARGRPCSRRCPTTCGRPWPDSARPPRRCACTTPGSTRPSARSCWRPWRARSRG